MRKHVIHAYNFPVISISSGRKRDWCFTCEFEGLVLKFKEGKSPVSPIGIISQLKSIGGQLGHGREEDAHEFLRWDFGFHLQQAEAPFVAFIYQLIFLCASGASYLMIHICRHAIDKMQSACLMESGKKKFTSMDEETTLIGLTFSGYFRSKVVYAIVQHIPYCIFYCQH